MCAAVAAVERSANSANSGRGSCVWLTGATSFTVSATLYKRTRWRGAVERAADEFGYEQDAAAHPIAGGSGWPHAYRALPDAADGAYCTGMYDGRQHHVECAIRDSNVTLRLTATWNDSSGAPLRDDTVEQVLTTFTPTAQRLLVGLVGRL